MKLRIRRLRSPTLDTARRRERAELASQEAHRRHVAAYPGAYDSATIILASFSQGPDRSSPEGTALGLVADHGATRVGLRAALAQVAVDHYQAGDPMTGMTYTAIAFESLFWDRVRAALETWLREDAELRQVAP